MVVALNEPTPEDERRWQRRVKQYSWLKLIISRRESVYASWNRIMEQFPSEVNLVWNIDDFRGARGTLAQISTCLQNEEEATIALGSDFFFQFTLWPLYFRSGRSKPDRFYPTAFPAFNLAAWEKVGPFMPAFKISGDKEWIARAAAAGASVKILPSAAGIRYNVGKGLSTRSDGRRICENIVLQKIHRKHLGNQAAYYDYYCELSQRCGVGHDEDC